MGDEAISVLGDRAQEELRWSHKQLEHPSFAARLSDVLASPLEGAVTLLPRTWRRRLVDVAEASIQRTVTAAVYSMGGLGVRPSGDWAHKLLAAGVGAVGGFFGPLAVLAELPVTTILMLRSIADIARSEGENLARLEARLACAQVFALGGRTRDDEDAEIGYYGMRITLGLHFECIAEFAGSAEGTHIPAAINFIRAVAARFGVVVSDSAAVRMIPITGALSGAALNLVFMQHFQDVARGHFIIRRLEREYGVDAIRDAYRYLEERETHASGGFSPVEGF